MPKQILVVDDDTTFREFVVEVLQRQNYTVDAAENGQRAVEYMESKSYDLVVSDIRMPGLDGKEVFEKSLQLQPQARVIMLTAYASLEDAVELMHKGAFYYIEKPCDPDRLEILVQRALENQQLQVENQHLRTELKTRYDFGNMVGKSKTMLEIFDHVATVAQSRSTVLIQGQSGRAKNWWRVQFITTAHASMAHLSNSIVLRCLKT
jgi:DNA-binding NtrC family response regulator